MLRRSICKWIAGSPLTPRLWLYFSHQRMFCLEMHFATFWERLHNEDPKQRPHDCLLNAIVSRVGALADISILLHVGHPHRQSFECAKLSSKDLQVKNCTRPSRTWTDCWMQFERDSFCHAGCTANAVSLRERVLPELPCKSPSCADYT